MMMTLIAQEVVERHSMSASRAAYTWNSTRGGWFHSSCGWLRISSQPNAQQPVWTSGPWVAGGIGNKSAKKVTYPNNIPPLRQLNLGLQMRFKLRSWFQPTLALVERLFAVWLVRACSRWTPLKDANFLMMSVLELYILNYTSFKMKQ